MTGFWSDLNDKIFCCCELYGSKILILKYFYAFGLKGLPGASSNQIVCPSVRLSVCLSVRNSVPLTNKVQ